jgi:hypothetical protein
MMSTMHPGASSRRLAREAEQRIREEDIKGPPKEGELDYLACKRRDYSLLEAPVFSAHELSPMAILLRRQQRERYHAMSPETQQAYCRDLDRRNEEAWEVATLMGVERRERNTVDQGPIKQESPEVEPEVEPEDDDDDPMYVLPRSRKGKTHTRFKSNER